ncbi:MAG: methyl-accepting chemotaxis protein [Rubrivivax sp.]|nr:methyl-accepting chemotaxis protein [Rubrivivax sp.]
MRSLRQIFTAAIALMVLCLLPLLLAIWRLDVAADAARAAEGRRTLSLLLADELRQSSDDLTRLARTYVVTGESKWEEQYFAVLDVRNGKKPRPPGYEKIHWDFLAAGQQPSHAGQPTTRALLEMMKDAGFTDLEFGKLKEAAANSDDLVRTETVAMNLVKGLRADDKGQFSVKGEPDRARAVAMMHDLIYHQNKAKIMKPVDEFLVLLDERTRAEVAAGGRAERTWFVVLVCAAVGLAALALVQLVVIKRWINARLGAEPAVVMRVVNAVAEGHLAQPCLATPQHPGSVMQALAVMADRLGATVQQVRHSADNVATASQQIAMGNTDLSARTEQQANSLQQTASSMEQLGATVQRNADGAREAATLASEASNVATRGGQVVNEVVLTMQGISESSRRIADIIGTIDGIAFQTNILALNAAVEAARAGEQGRGFAVVASEVRSLAQRSAESAREIKSLISTSVERVERGTLLVDQAGQTMTEVVQAIGRVAELVSEISSASGEQSAGVAQVGQAVSSMDQATQQNAALVQQSAAAAASMREQAQGLVAAMAGFKVA